MSTSLDYTTAMPVVKTRTLLSIDRYAEIMGVNPVFFNQGAQVNLPNGATLFPQRWRPQMSKLHGSNILGVLETM